MVFVKDKGKGKDHPRTSHEGSEGEQKYISALSLTSALDGGVDGQHHAPAALTPGKTWYSLYVEKYEIVLCERWPTLKTLCHNLLGSTG